jgi:phage baseplate assembly protein W
MSNNNRFAAYPQAWVVDDMKVIEGRLVADQFVHVRQSEDGSEEIRTALGKRVFHKKSGAMLQQIRDMEDHIESLRKVMEETKKEMLKEILDPQQLQALGM